jgi:hypothetical protein
MKELSIRDPFPERLNEPPVMDRLKTGRNISLDDPVISMLPDRAKIDIPDGIHRATIGAEAERILAEIRFIDRFQHHPYGFLHNPILDRRDAQSRLPILSNHLRD